MSDARLRLWRERTLLLEAVAQVALASLMIRLAPFRRVAAWASRAPTAPLRQNPALAAQRIGWAVRLVSAHVPWRAVCFQQSLAAQAMLRRRGVASTLYYGASNDVDGALVAHTWVRLGEIDVVGTENAADYAVLAMFPGVRSA